MPRIKRIDVVGCLYHVIGRGIERRKIFRDSKDRVDFLSRLGKALGETGCQCYAWALMDNHFHLLLRPLRDPLGRLMRKLLTGYVFYFNRRHSRVGHLFQNRYKSILCQEDSYFKELVRYIHLNPVRAKVVETPEMLSKYAWTGHSVLLGKRPLEWQSKNEVLSLFGLKRRQAIANYEKFVQEGWRMGFRRDLVQGGLVSSAGGLKGLRQLKKMKEKWQSDSRILGDGDYVSKILKQSHDKWEKRICLEAEGWDLDKLESIVREKFALEKGSLVSGRRYRAFSIAKGVFSFLATEILAYSLMDVGRYLGISRQSVFELKQKSQSYIDQHGSNLIS